MKAISKQEEQLKKSWVKKKYLIKTLKREKRQDILMNFDMNFTSEPKNILKKAATDERMIHHNNLFFKTGDTIIKNFDFLKKIWYIA